MTGSATDSAWPRCRSSISSRISPRAAWNGCWPITLPAGPVSVLYPRNRQLSPRVRMFLDWIVQQFAAAAVAADWRPRDDRHCARRRRLRPHAGVLPTKSELRHPVKALALTGFDLPHQFGEAIDHVRIGLQGRR